MNLPQKENNDKLKFKFFKCTEEVIHVLTYLYIKKLKQSYCTCSGFNLYHSTSIF